MRVLLWLFWILQSTTLLSVVVLGQVAPLPTEEQMQESIAAVNEWASAHPQGAAPGQGITDVKVFFHVLKRGDSPAEGAFSAAEAKEGLKYVNKVFNYFTDFNFIFGGISQTTNKRWFEKCETGGDSMQAEYGQILRRGGLDVVNVYICRLEQSLRIMAKAPYFIPANGVIDGVHVFNPNVPLKSTGQTTPFLDFQVSLTHVIFHWMGLQHTWYEGTEVCGPEQIADGVDDTPGQRIPSIKDPGFDGTCFLKGKNLDTCPDEEGYDPVNNWMDNTSIYCWDKYGYLTAGQVLRLNALFAKYRYQKRACKKNGRFCTDNEDCCSQKCKNNKCKYNDDVDTSL